MKKIINMRELRKDKTLEDMKDLFKYNQEKTFNSLGQLIKISDNYGGEVNYEYDSNGNNIKIEYHTGKIILMTYDENNVMISKKEILKE